MGVLGSMNRAWDRVDRFMVSSWNAGVFLMALAVTLCGPGLLLFHGFEFLKYGEWQSYALINAWGVWGPKAEAWAAFPTSWLGLHKLLSWFPLWLACLLMGPTLFKLHIEELPSAPTSSE